MLGVRRTQRMAKKIGKRRILAGAVVGGVAGLALGLLLLLVVGNYLVFTTILGMIAVAFDRALGGEPRGVARRLFGRIENAIGGGIPEHWTDVRSSAVVVPVSTVNASLAEAGILKAVKIREALVRLCQDRFMPDAVFQAIDRKRRAGQALTTEEAQYVKQADANYLELACDKMQVVLFYEGDFFALAPEDRLVLHRLVERYPGCSLVSGPQGIGDRLIRRIHPQGQITEDEAETVLHEMLRSGA